MWVSSLVSILPLVAFAFALPSKDYEHQVKEEVVPPQGWTIFGPAPSDHFINLRIGLPQSNFDLLEQHLYEISDPYHERYGAHLTKEEVEDLVAPHPDSAAAVNEWLSSHGIQEEDINRSPAGDWLTIRLPVWLVEKMLDTKYHIWKHATSGDYIVRTTSYSLPKDILDHVELIQPTTMFGTFKRLKSTIHSISQANSQVQSQNQPPVSDPVTGVTVDASCGSTITITCLQQMYNAVGYTPSADVGNSVGIAGYLGDFANRADLQSFFEDQVPAAAAANATYNFVSVAGKLCFLGFSSWLTLSKAVSTHKIPTTLAWSLTSILNLRSAGSPPFIPDVATPTDTNEPYTDWLDFMLSYPNPPLAISTSYGDDEQTVPESFAKRACAGFAQLGARGVSLMVASGDKGVGDANLNPATQTCFTNDGQNRTQFLPGFPASCPFVTTVGGTVLYPEQAVYFSGGGFSNYFARPSYQDAAVQGYLSQLPNGTYSGLFNPNGRGFPDVAAQSNLFRVFVTEQPFLIGGTSASSPTFTGVVTLLNDARLKKGLPPLGFLNPLIYSTAASGFNDITVGSNYGCGTLGFSATAGWDPVTGFGTPNFAKLVELVT
ncbi:Tripeptidyl-peptidase sed2 [Mycena sanguinolenta]|uniref:tripeptidyl-peptidase II n=1 Tax=Mycena sanguinolenta TaxID=230812 RepID=A0A8H6X700_9AGAR|nr:Tripeptidyl-peptidase sed2 [Mycena sanguinolenta]